MAWVCLMLNTALMINFESVCTRRQRSKIESSSADKWISHLKRYRNLGRHFIAASVHKCSPSSLSSHTQNLFVCINMKKPTSLGFVHFVASESPSVWLGFQCVSWDWRYAASAFPSMHITACLGGTLSMTMQKSPPKTTSSPRSSHR